MVNVSPLVTQATKLARAYAEGNMTSTVRISRPTDATFSRTTGLLSEPAEAQVYVGKARITPVEGPVQLAIGDDPQFYSSCYVSVPLSVLPQVDDIVQITANPDAGVVGRFFRIEDVEGAGLMPVVRRMRVTGIQHSRKQTYTTPSQL